MGRVSFIWIGAVLVLGGVNAVGCIDDSSKTPNAAFDAKAPELPPIDAAVSDTFVPPPPILDASGDGPAFATGLGAGATVTKSGKYTLITKTGGSPGGHGIS